MLKTLILDHQCQNAENKHEMIMLNAEIRAARVMAESTSQKTPASFEAIQSMIQENENLQAG